jgi:uncharacterized transporter YbjL
VLKRILFVFTAVALVVGASALPALAQEEGSEKETASCASFVKDVKKYVYDYAVGKIAVEEAAARVVEELKKLEADGVVCSRAELAEIARTPGAKDVAEIVSAQYPLAK